MLQGEKENINTWITRINTDSKAAISVDCVVFGYDETGLKILLIDCDMPPHEGKMSIVGDLVRSDENLDQAATRILEQRTGLANLYMEQVKAFSEPKRHPLGRVITLAYYSLIKIKDYIIVDKEHKQPKWINIEDIGDLAFDHNEIVSTCLESLQKKVREHPIGFSLLPKKFSLMQLQNLYETVLGIELDKRNFRRKLNSLKLLIDLGENQKEVSHRPAKLYSFDFEKYDSKRKKGKLNFEL